MTATAASGVAPRGLPDDSVDINLSIDTTADLKRIFAPIRGHIHRTMDVRDAPATAAPEATASPAEPKPAGAAGDAAEDAPALPPAPGDDWRAAPGDAWRAAASRARPPSRNSDCSAGLRGVGTELGLGRDQCSGARAKEKGDRSCGQIYQIIFQSIGFKW